MSDQRTTSRASGRIDAIFARLRSQQAKGLMPFVCAGRPALDALPDVLAAAQDAGAHIVEVGVPFSDPIADGPVIAAAMHNALVAGVTPAGVFEQVARCRDALDVGLVAMVSVSIVRRMGQERFMRQAADAGFDGLIVPDAPAEESAPLVAAASDAGLTMSLLAAPTSSDERLARICSLSSGFVYLLARLGVTGERDQAPTIQPLVHRLRPLTGLPIACGFGISSAEQVRDVVAHADAAIVGSALVRRMEGALESGGAAAAVREAGACIAALARGLPQAG